jgi:outer membrane receptor protein involved in Fe transport
MLLPIEAYSANPEIDLADLSLEELMSIKVTGVSKFEQTVAKAPSSVSIVTADEIKKYGYRTLVEILKSIRSFYITYDRNYSKGFADSGGIINFISRYNRIGFEINASAAEKANFKIRSKLMKLGNIVN